MLKSWRFWVGCAFSLGLLYLFFRQVNFGEIGQALAGARYIFVLPAVVVLIIDMGLKAWRWQFLIKPLKPVPLRSVFSIEVIGHMTNAILPLRIGELVRAYLLGEKEQVSKISALATVVVKIVFDGLALLFVAVVLALFLPLADWLRQAIYIAAAIFLSLLVIFLLLASSRGRLERVAAFLLRPLPRRWSARLQGWLSLFVYGLEAIRSPRRTLLVFLLSVLAWVAEGTMFYIISFAFDLGQPFYVLLLASTAANLALLLPAGPGGIGNFELASATVLSLFGVGESLAGAYVIAVHALLLIPIILLGFYFVWVENVSLAEMARQRKAAALPDKGQESAK